MDSIFEEKKSDVFDHTGHILLEKIGNGKFKNACGNCGLLRAGAYNDLMKPKSTKFCAKCIDPGRKHLMRLTKDLNYLKLNRQSQIIQF